MYKLIMTKTKSTLYYMKKLNEYGRSHSEIEWEQKSPVQKIASHIKTVNEELRTIDKLMKKAIKIKNENGVSSDGYWKRTKNSFLKIETKMQKIVKKLRELQS